MRWLFGLVMLSSVVVLFVPGNETERHMVFGGLSNAYLKALTYCDRNPHSCARGKALIGEFTRTAADGLKKIAVTARDEAEQAIGNAGQEPYDSYGRRGFEGGTLDRNDLAPQWQAP